MNNLQEWASQVTRFIFFKYFYTIIWKLRSILPLFSRRQECLSVSFTPEKAGQGNIYERCRRWQVCILLYRYNPFHEKEKIKSGIFKIILGQSSTCTDYDITYFHKNFSSTSNTNVDRKPSWSKPCEVDFPFQKMRASLGVVNFEQLLSRSSCHQELLLSITISTQKDECLTPRGHQSKNSTPSGLSWQKYFTTQTPTPTQKPNIYAQIYYFKNTFSSKEDSSWLAMWVMKF